MDICFAAMHFHFEKTSPEVLKTAQFRAIGERYGGTDGETWTVVLSNEPHRQVDALPYVPWQDVGYARQDDTIVIKMGPEYCRLDLGEKRAWMYCRPQASLVNRTFFTLHFFRALSLLLAVARGGIALHCSALLRGGKKGRTGIVCTGPSGSGKTSIAARIMPRWRLINDECNILLPEEGRWHIHGTPFTRPEFLQYCTNEYVALDHLFTVRTGERNEHRKMSARETFGAIVSNSAITPPDDDFFSRYSASARDLSLNIPGTQLIFVNDRSVLPVVDSLIGE